METKSIRISKHYHNEIKRYLVEKGYDGENIKSFVDAAIYNELVKGNHKFSTRISPKKKK